MRDRAAIFASQFAAACQTFVRAFETFDGQHGMIALLDPVITLRPKRSLIWKISFSVSTLPCSVTPRYTPTRERGSHAFSRVPPAANCTGGGRSTFICHAGTMERRRGDSYLGKEFSEPAGLPEDVHVKQKMTCVDCHQTAPGGMGHIERRATCQDCHPEVEQAMAPSDFGRIAAQTVAPGAELTPWST